MSRKPSALIPLLIAVLALTVAPAGAAASSFQVDEYPATLSGEQVEGEVTHNFGGNEVSCGSMTLSGTIEEASSSVELHPEYSECKAFGFTSATVDTAECNYAGHVEEEVGEGEWVGSGDVLCPEGQTITIDASTCQVKMHQEITIKEFKFTTEWIWKIFLKVDFGWKEVRYTVTKDGFLCPLKGTGEFEDGEVTGAADVVADGETQNFFIE